MVQAKILELAERRIMLGWSKADLATNSSLSRAVVVRAEQGLGVSPKSAKRIADALGVPVCDVFALQLKKKEA